MRWVYPLSPEREEGPDVLGGKAHGLVVLRRLGLPVPPGFVVGIEAGLVETLNWQGIFLSPVLLVEFVHAHFNRHRPAVRVVCPPSE